MPVFGSKKVAPLAEEARETARLVRLAAAGITMLSVVATAYLVHRMLFDA